VRGRSEIQIALLAGIPLIVGAIALTGSGVSSAPVAARVLAAVSSPLAILDGRSPGTRTAGTVQTKFAAAPHPTQRVLSQVRERPSVPAAPGQLSPAALENLPVLSPGNVLAGGPTGMILPASAPVPIGGGPGSLLVPVIPVGDVPVTPITPPTPPPAVPEPVTWATLLTGLGIISARLRLERRRKTRMAASLAG